MPFLGALIGLWLTVTVGVMAYYFLVVARSPQARTRSLPSRPEPYHRVIAQPDRPWIQAPTTVAPSRSDLPAYDMENFPHEKWGSPSTAT